MECVGSESEPEGGENNPDDRETTVQGATPVSYPWGHESQRVKKSSGRAHLRRVRRPAPMAASVLPKSFPNKDMLTSGVGAKGSTGLLWFSGTPNHAAHLLLAEAAFHEAVAAADRHRSEYAVASGADDRSHQRLVAELRETAAPAIAASVAELRARLGETFASVDFYPEQWSNGRRFSAWTNSPSIDARASAIRAAIEALALMSLDAIDGEAVKNAAAALLAALPEVERRPGSLAAITEEV